MSQIQIINDNIAKSNRRGESFSKEENMSLCKAWVAISLDGIIGTDQKGKQLWDRIMDLYKRAQPDTKRSLSSLQKRWTIISKEVTLYSGFYGQADREASSGTNEVDKVSVL